MISGHLMQYCSETKNKNTGKYQQTYIFQVDVDSFEEENVILFPLLAKWEGGVSIDSLDRDDFLSLGNPIQETYLNLRESRVGFEDIDCDVDGDFRTLVVCNANQINKVLRTISETINLFDSNLINQLDKEYKDCPFVICYWKKSLSPNAVVINFEPKYPGFLYYPSLCKLKGNSLLARKDTDRNATFLFGDDEYGENSSLKNDYIKDKIWGKLMIGDDFNCDYYFDLKQLNEDDDDDDILSLWDLTFTPFYVKGMNKWK
jgi:hypothetical protein